MRAPPLRAVAPVQRAASMRDGALCLEDTNDIGQRSAWDFMYAATPKPRLVASYSSELSMFIDFFALEGLSPLEADTLFILCYVPWAADRGRNKACAFQPCLFAINTFFRYRHLKEHVHGPWPAGQPCHKPARSWRKWTCARRTSACSSRRTSPFGAHGARKPCGPDCDWHVFRTFLATAVGFQFFYRSQTSTTDRVGDVAVDSRMMTLFRRECCKTHGPNEIIHALQVSRSAHPEIADLMHAFVRYRPAMLPAATH